MKLFNAYKMASNKTFVEYITRLQECYENGEDITPEALMHELSGKQVQNLIVERKIYCCYTQA